MMWKERESYDPKSYGKLKAEFLKNVALMSEMEIKKPENEEEKERLKLIKDIREGRLRPTRPPIEQKEAENR